jgi:outer membrane biogenesis lipoprotein LolB
MKFSKTIYRDLTFFIFGLLIFSIFLLTGCATSSEKPKTEKQCPEYTRTLIA